MHPNPIYRKTSRDRNMAFAHHRSFGMLSISGPDGPLNAHIPFVLSKDGTRLDAHILASNPIWRALETPQPAVIAITGPDGYISPDWYGIDDQVPTWNYIAVHLRGTLKRLDQSSLRPHLEQLSAQFETRLLPKPVWTIDKVTPETLERFERMIRPVTLEITDIESTWKLNQNKTDAARLGAADAVTNSQIGSDLGDLADLMRKPPNDS